MWPVFAVLLSASTPLCSFNRQCVAFFKSCFKGHDVGLTVSRYETGHNLLGQFNDQ